MKKLVFVLLSLVLILPLFTACGGTATTDPTEPPTNGDDPFVNNTLSLTEDGFFPLTLDEYVERITVELDAMGYTIGFFHSAPSRHPHPTLGETVNVLIAIHNADEIEVGAIFIDYIEDIGQIKTISSRYPSGIIYDLMEIPPSPQEVFYRAKELFERLVISSALEMTQGEMNDIMIAIFFEELPEGHLYQVETEIRDVLYTNRFDVLQGIHYIFALNIESIQHRWESVMNQ